MSFGRERALYQIIGIKKAQIQILRDRIKKLNRRTYFSFVINVIIRVSSNSEEKFISPCRLDGRGRFISL